MLNEIETLRSAGRLANRHRWIVLPLRALLFPLLRPYLLAGASRQREATAQQARESAERDERMAARIEAVAAEVAALRAAVAELRAAAEDGAALKATVAELTRVVGAWGVASGDLPAIAHRLADLEDELGELKERSPR